MTVFCGRRVNFYQKIDKAAGFPKMIRQKMVSSAQFLQNDPGCSDVYAFIRMNWR